MYAPPWVNAGQVKLDDVGAELVNSFAKGAEIANRREQMQNELRRLDLAIQEQKNLTSYRNQELELRKKGLDMTNEFRSRGLDLREETMNRKFDDLNQGREEYSNISKGLADIDPNDQDASKQFWNLVGDNPYGAMSTGGRQAQRNWWQGYNQNARTKGASLRADYNTWATDVKNSLGGGYPVDTSLLLNPNVWKPEYTEYGDYGAPKGKPTGNVFVTVGTNKTTGEPIYLTRPKSFVDQKVKEYADFQKRFAGMPKQQSVPSLDVFPQSDPDAQNQLSDQDVQALNWAQTHPDDPRAAQIKQKLGSNQ